MSRGVAFRVLLLMCSQLHPRPYLADGAGEGLSDSLLALSGSRITHGTSFSRV